MRDQRKTTAREDDKSVRKGHPFLPFVKANHKARFQAALGRLLFDERRNGMRRLQRLAPCVFGRNAKDKPCANDSPSIGVSEWRGKHRLFERSRTSAKPPCILSPKEQLESSKLGESNPASKLYFGTLTVFGNHTLDRNSPRKASRWLEALT